MEKAANIYANKQGLELKPFAIKFFKSGAQWQKEQTIKKTCKWLADNVINYIWCSKGGGLGISDKFLLISRK